MLGYLVILLLGVAIGFVFGIAYGMGIVVQRVREYRSTMGKYYGSNLSAISRTIDKLLAYLEQ